MSFRKEPLVNDYYYHIFNRGVEKRAIFLDTQDHIRFLELLYYYQFGDPKPSFSQQKRFPKNNFENNPRIIEITCYCLMPNHFHLDLKQLQENGIEQFLMKVLDSYTKYFNEKYKRVGPLFQGRFKSKIITNEEQLLHLTRYIHLNPCSAGLVNKPEDYEYSSYKEYIYYPQYKGICNPKPILSFFKNPNAYKIFVEDNIDYAKKLKEIEHLTLED